MLTDHFLRRISGQDPEEFSAEEKLGLTIESLVLYEHALASINYTTYDVRRGQDKIHVKTAKQDIMLLAEPEDSAHPYVYARVLGIYHAMVSHSVHSPKPQRMEIMWVRWFQVDETSPAGFLHWNLDRVHFVHIADPDRLAFGFVDPARVLRACHLIPAFAYGRSTQNEFMGPSVVADKDGDWRYFYVNRFVLCVQNFTPLNRRRFVDRDMFMRYTGLGVGHVDNLPFNGLTLRNDLLDMGKDKILEKEALLPEASPADPEAEGESGEETDKSGDDNGAEGIGLVTGAAGE